MTDSESGDGGAGKASESDRMAKPALCEICANEVPVQKACDASRIDQQRAGVFECAEFAPKHLSDGFT